MTSQQVTTDAPATSSTTAVESREPPTICGVRHLGRDVARRSHPPRYRSTTSTLAWTKAGAFGLPALIGDQVLMPVDGGLAVFAAANGNPGIVPDDHPGRSRRLHRPGRRHRGRHA